MPLIWERIPTALESEFAGGHPHPCNALYRLQVPGGWLIRDETVRIEEGGTIVLPASGPTHFIPDANHEWHVEVEPARVHQPLAASLVD